jgi:uncharacterized membrane protein
MIRLMSDVSARPHSIVARRQVPRAVPADGAFLALLFAAVFAVALLRFGNLEQRVLWLDEGISVLRAAGYTQAEFAHAIHDGREHTVREIRVYQGRGIAREPGAVVRSLMFEDPQHPPLYYVLLNLWQRAAGGSVAAQRVLSVLIGLSLIPAMYWLCMELFRCPVTAAIGAALVAVSPFFFAYSHQLREYGLLAVSAVVAQALLLHAYRSGRPLTWMLYAFSLAIGLYTDLFFALIVVAHVLFVLAAPNHRASKWIGIAAIACGLILYAPWIAVLSLHAQTADQTNAWSSVRWPLSMLAAKWAFNIGTVFFDLEYQRLWLAAFLLPVLALAGYAAVFAVTKTSATQRLSIGTLLFSTIIVFSMSDFAMHAHRSAITRYGTLSYVAVLLAMTALLGSLTARPRTRTLGLVLTLAIVAGGLVSCIAASRNLVWWDNHQDDELIPIAARINAVRNPLIISSGASKMLYLLSFRLNDDARVMFPRSRLPAVSGRNVFLAATQESARDFLGTPGVVFQPLYVARYSLAWETFHRPLRPGEFADAAEQKLSLWRVWAVKP